MPILNPGGATSEPIVSVDWGAIVTSAGEIVTSAGEVVTVGNVGTVGGSVGGALAEHLRDPNPHPQYKDKEFLQFFSNPDLSIAGVVPIIHGLGTLALSITVCDNSGEQVQPDQIEILNETAISINLVSFVPLSGNWNVQIRGF